MLPCLRLARIGSSAAVNAAGYTNAPIIQDRSVVDQGIFLRSAKFLTMTGGAFAAALVVWALLAIVALAAVGGFHSASGKSAYCPPCVAPS